MQNQLSGNLLRKFKNSNGWQKLWVVFTNFCLFFYKSHQVSAARPGSGGGGRLGAAWTRVGTSPEAQGQPRQAAFCRSAQDNHPLASLPLLGYSLTIPSESEDIHKDYVFKLHFKSHVYYFRAESEYTFER